MLGKRQVEIIFQREEILHTHTHARPYIKDLLSSTLHSENSCQMTEMKRGRKRKRDSENECKRGKEKKRRKRKPTALLGFHQHLYKQSMRMLEAQRHTLVLVCVSFNTHTLIYLLPPNVLKYRF